MDNAEYVAKSSWIVLKFIFEVIYEHLPLILISIAVAFVIGCIALYFLLSLAKKKSFFQRNSDKKFYRVLAKSYKYISVLTLLFLAVTIGAWLSSRYALKIEVRKSVDAGFEFLEETYFQDEVFREEIYSTVNTLIQSGSYVESFNEAIVDGALQVASEEQGSNYFSMKLTQWVAAPQIEEKLLEYEKAALGMLTLTAIESIGMEQFVTYAGFERAFDAWINADFDDVSLDLKDTIFTLIFKYAGPLVLSVFLPFMAVALLILAIPFIDFFIYKRKEEKRLAQEVRN